MKNSQCPLCYTILELIDCAPCDDCGNQAEEINHFNEGIHTYKIFNVYKGLKLQLCNFCQVDFGSYKSEYLGFKNKETLFINDFEFISDVKNPEITKDKYCPSCNKRLKFLNFIKKIRNLTSE